MKIIKALLFFPLALSAQLTIDHDGDGHSDIWQSTFGVPSASPEDDLDNDGYTNKEEETAGTNPLSRFSYPRFEDFHLNQDTEEAEFVVRMRKGKRYSIYSNTDLGEIKDWKLLAPPYLGEKDITGTLPGSFLAPFPSTVFFRLHIGDVDEDKDGLTAFEECLLGTSDKTPNTSGNPRLPDHAVAENWLQNHAPGTNPKGPQENLVEVSLAHLQDLTTQSGTHAFLLSAAGSRDWHQLTSWILEQNGSFTELETTPPIAGKFPIVHDLFDLQGQNGQPRFVTGTIRPDGGLWLSSRQINFGGQFTHHGSRGFGPQVNLEIQKYDIASRILGGQNQRPTYQIITPVVGIKTTGNHPTQVRILVWSLDPDTGDLSAQHDSGPLPVEAIGNSSTDFDVVGLDNDTFALVHRQFGGVNHTYFSVSRTGVVTFINSESQERELGGLDGETLLPDEIGLGITPLNGEGYLGAYFAKRNDASPISHLNVAVFEKRAIHDLPLSPQRITDNTFDLNPDVHGTLIDVDGFTNSTTDGGTTELVRGMLTDLRKEAIGGDGSGTLLSRNINSNLPRVHIASCTKLMTLLIAAIELDNGNLDLDEFIIFSERAAGTGGSHLKQWTTTGTPDVEYNRPYPAVWDTLTRRLDSEGEQIGFFAEGDRFRLRMLIHAMMMESCNKSSVAIAERISNVLYGDPHSFLIRMNEVGTDAGMTSTTWGHPAGGCITTPQDMIRFLTHAWKNETFRQYSGVHTFGHLASDIGLAGVSGNFLPKSNGAFESFTASRLYPGIQAFKGGNGGLWWYEYLPKPEASWCTAASMLRAERLGHPLAVVLQQSGDTSSDGGNLLDYGYRRLFTPDFRGETTWQTATGGLTTDARPPEVTKISSAVVSDRQVVTAIINRHEKLQLISWNVSTGTGSANARSLAEKEYALLGQDAFASNSDVQIHSFPNSTKLMDLLTVEVLDENLTLKLWQIDGNR